MSAITKERIELFIKNPLDNGLTRGEQMELARIALTSLEVEPIGFRCRRNDNLGDWSYVYHREPDDFERKHLVIEGIYAAPPVPVVPEEKPMPNPLSMYAVDAVAAIAEVRGWNACRAAMLQSQREGNPHVTPARLPGGFTIEDAKELHEDLVRSHISQALSGEKMKKKDRDADLLWIHGVIVQAAWFVKASLDALPEPLREEKGGSPTEESEAGL
ncbi:TPA: dTDP-6-deoxy-L-hexose 3-O-methyltransferase [Escherichia coli]|nr:dTDP-6-deoxy-L-hexose 3-O-methyltransferase [Escherichia coli]HAX7215089.1 dTDP-6-deoxy-L-hexose 3-O-methyltransferase [Escherichia coli]